MRHIEFRALHATDFKCYRDVSFDFAGFGPGCHAIRGVNTVTPRLGSNGAGKSTLWDALCFVLFGRSTKRLRGPDLVPYGEPHKCPVVRLELVVDGDAHLIERRAQPHALRLDGAIVSQERIDALIGIDLDVFLHTILLAQGTPLFLDLEPRHKLAMLSETMRLDRFDLYAQRAKVEVEALATQDGSLKLSRMAVEGQLHELEREVADCEKRAKEFAVASRAIVERLTAEHDAAVKALNAAAIPVIAAQVDRDAVYSQLKDATEAMVAAQVGHAQGVNLRIKVGRMTIGSACPSCGQPVTQAARQKLSDAAERMIEASPYEKLQAAHAKLAEDYRTVANDCEKLQATERAAERAVGEAAGRLHAAAAAKNPHAEQLPAIRERLTKLQQRAIRIDSERHKLEKQRQRINPWVDGFRQIRLMVLDDVLATLSLLTTSYANELGLPCDVKFAIERTTKSGTTVSGIHMSVDAVEKLEAWSGGEAQRLRLAASLALSATLLAEASIGFNLLALDEPSAHLSPEGLDELTGFLATHAEAEGRMVFVTDQRPLNAASTVTLTRTPENVVLGA